MKIYEVLTSTGVLKKGTLLKETQLLESEIKEFLKGGIIKEFKSQMLFDTSSDCEVTEQ